MKLIDKAQAYDEVLNKLRHFIAQGVDPLITRADVQDFFPGLKDSEDERTRKYLISFVKLNSGVNLPPEDAEQILAWLEKQGKQKPTDKLESKFHEGEWIVWKDKCYKVNYNGCGYELIDQNGLSTSLEYGTVDKSAHLWTITDAKDGDVLVANIHHWEIGGNVENFPVRVPTIFIYQKVKTDKENIHAYVSLYNGNSLVLSNSMYYNTFVYNIQPATKKQRELLFQKMKEEGYKWNNKNKELKKFHVIDEGKDEMDYCFTKMMNGEKVSSVWSKEDEKRLDTICGLLEDIPSHQNWLRTLKDRVQLQQRMTCNEEDNKIIEEIINDIECARAINYHAPKEGYEFRENWLKSFKGRVQSKQEWKPSNEQIESLFALLPTTCSSNPIFSLYEDLKKLMEE